MNFIFNDFVNFGGVAFGILKHGLDGVEAAVEVGGVEVFEPNTKSIFWAKKNLNFGAKTKIWGLSTTLNSNFGVSN